MSEIYTVNCKGVIVCGELSPFRSMIVSDREMLFIASNDKIIYDVDGHSRRVSRIYLHRLLRGHIFVYVNIVLCTMCDGIYCMYVCMYV